MKRLLAVMFFLAGIVGAQVQHPGYVGEITGLPTCDSNRDGLYASITNGSTADEDCSTTGTDTVPCYCDGTSWEPMGSGGGVGQARRVAGTPPRRGAAQRHPQTILRPPAASVSAHS